MLLECNKVINQIKRHHFAFVIVISSLKCYIFFKGKVYSNIMECTLDINFSENLNLS